MGVFAIYTRKLNIRFKIKAKILFYQNKNVDFILGIQANV